MKLVKTVAVWGVVIVLLLLWHHYLVSSRPPKLKAWEPCRIRLLDEWAASHSDRVEAVRQFTRDHAYSFGAGSPNDHFDDHDSRNTAVSDAAKLGINEDELIRVDRRIADECGHFPRE
jgi:hypothetical protein